MTHKETALAFLRLLTSGKVRDAYDMYVHDDFIHHNQFHKGDAVSLMHGMEENEENFPNKEFVVKKSLEDEDTVMTYSFLHLGDSVPDMKVVHILRFLDNKVIEMWDIAQPIQKDSPNENGAF
jgi:predicted SnoaL-like aldol condensation-catalyzing enzyme